MIEAKNISKWFDGQRVLYDISATFDTGKTNLIIGQSGSGKTVFMKCLIGLLTPEEGTIMYDGRNFREMSVQQKRLCVLRLVSFSGSALFDNETVLGNVMFPLKMFSPSLMPNNSKGLTSAYNAWGSQMPMRNIPPRYRAVCKNVWLLPAPSH